ncbi:acyl-CoA thioesterase II [Pseudofrankia sp. EUN1h]|nr:acyl-CoA thioesterase II [Pseudofrankia sp. EUN1h]
MDGWCDGRVSIDPALRQTVLDSLDGLLAAFELEPLGADRFRVRSEPPRFNRVFGGQSLAQALVAARATVTGQEPSSLHASFVQAGKPGVAVELVVDRVRDGRSMSTRQVTVRQGDRVLLAAIVTFHANGPGPEPPVDPSVPTADPELLPLLQDWAVKAPPELRPQALFWVDRPPPLEMRLAEPVVFMGGTPAAGPRSHWMRLPRDVGADPGLHAALLTYASDYFLLDMAFRSYPDGATPDYSSACSLDHTIWLHRPVRFDRWHRHTQEAVVVAGHRGLVRGAIHDADGRLVATVAQEVLVRPKGAST